MTFWAGSQLRGCVGAVSPADELGRCVEAVTKASLQDPRFCDEPITAKELPGLTIEISVLSDLWRATEPERLIPGVHGVMVRRADRSGCFLPKVARERNWSAADLLSWCCEMKAGLPRDAWRDPDTEVLLFTVEAFCEPGPLASSYTG